MIDITANVEAVYRRLEAAARRSGRQASDITLVAVTKTHPLETVREAYQAGLRHFGENRAAEGQEKVIGLAEWLEQNGLEPPTWHMIGHLQSRQVGDILGRFQLIHSVDTLKLAQRIDRLASRDDYPPVDILLQCNVSGERTKSGFELERWSSSKEQLADFLDIVGQITALDKVTIRGLMTMAPLVDDPEEVRPDFKRLAALRSKLMEEMPGCDWRHLSMGMTDDFEVAIEEGATIVRIGRALFGERKYT